MSTKQMLINATQEESRVAVVEGQWLSDLDIELLGREQKKSNIYKARITRAEDSLDAYFVDYGAKRQGFLPRREIAHTYLAHGSLREGDELIVQIDKEERGSKGAALTTFISLAGPYLVLMPNNPRAGGISRRIDGDERAELREVMSALKFPEGMGVIIRTAGVGRNIEELQWDLDALLRQWQMIQDAANERMAPFLIHQESNVILRALRDHLRQDIVEIIIDNPTVYEEIRMHVERTRPEFLDRIKLYQDATPLFTRYQIEAQLQSAFRRQLPLPSGGVIVIDHTEALISIDINSAKATRGGDIEETAFHTNLEAANEIARQLRLRDLGGLIVIDFIDMASQKHQRLVENRLREALSTDRARVQIGRISRFGLLEMSRQRLKPTLGESSQIACPRCEGHGVIHTVPSLAVTVLRVLEEEALKEQTAQVRATVPIELATYLVNEKRGTISQLEQRHGVKIVIIPNAHLSTPQYKIDRIRIEEDGEKPEVASYSLIEEPKAVIPESYRPPKTPATEPAVKTVIAEPAPQHVPGKKLPSMNFFKWLWRSIMGSPTPSRPKEHMGHDRNMRHVNRHRPPMHRGHNRSRGKRPGGNQSSGPRHHHRRPPQGQSMGNKTPHRYYQNNNYEERQHFHDKRSQEPHFSSSETVTEIDKEGSL